MMRQAWIDKRDAVAVVRQCVLAGVSRTTVYAQQEPRRVDESDLLLSHLIDEEYAPQEVPLGDTRHPFYGSRKMVVFLKNAGRSVKHEGVNLKGYASMGELMVGRAEYFAFYNGEHPYQSPARKCSRRCH